ncbi:molybdenum cofactor synthesis protein 2 large subunit [Phytophthora cinnamomi]|uniref:molybdenum cofactor synthesis protein 2 large subunit n=1 Tax=Phytophthora cinnamomi TaxID=4785 RepID=UPI003559DCB6|nr:molybdenum cofactor synthesis protein 2 large subunit [Phytophthora cinnamomi]
MGAVRGIEPRRLALRYEPPGIIVEYVYHGDAGRQLYHHEIDLKAELSLGSGRFSEYRIEGLVHDIIKQHKEVVGDSKVPPSQLVRLVRKLVDHQRTPSEVVPSPAPTLPQADYNRVSETQLKQVKQKMDLVFEQNIVRPDQEGYQYDKQVEFQAATEASDWDD